MSDFERVQRQVGGRAILITSWFDDGAQNWRASAPGYSHLSSVITEAPGECPSRKAAVERLASRLATHFTAKK